MTSPFFSHNDNFSTIADPYENLSFVCEQRISKLINKYLQNVINRFEDPKHAALWQDPSVWYSGQYAWSKVMHLLGGEYRDMARLMRIGSSDHAELLFAILPTLPGFDHTIIEEEEDFQEYDSSGEDELEAAEFLASALRMHPAVFNEVVAEAVAAGEFDEPDDDDEDE